MKNMRKRLSAYFNDSKKKMTTDFIEQLFEVLFLAGLGDRFLFNNTGVLNLIAIFGCMAYKIVKTHFEGEHISKEFHYRFKNVEEIKEAVDERIRSVKELAGKVE